MGPKDFVCRCGDPVKYGGPFRVVGIGNCWKAGTNVILEQVAYVSVVQKREVEFQRPGVVGVNSVNNLVYVRNLDETLY